MAWECRLTRDRPKAQFPRREGQLAVCVLFLCIGCFATAESSVQDLSIERAVNQALADEPQIRAYQLQADAHDKLKEAAKQLPGPTVRTGLLNVPLDGFALNAEPMTQTLVGVRQTIPPIGARSAMSLNHEQLREAFSHRASLVSKNAKFDTRSTWLEAHYLRHEIDLTSQAIKLLENLADVVRARYATGDELQYSVIAAELELNRLKSRLIDTQRREFKILAQLQRLTGISQPVAISQELPPWRAIPSRQRVVDALSEHPRVQVADATIVAESAKVLLNQAAFKPEWHIDLSYGKRAGVDFNGDARSDFTSATLSFSLPIAVKRRQELRLSAAYANEDAARQTKIEVLRDMAADIAIAFSEWKRLTERIELLNDAIVPQSHNHAQAALNAYQNKEGSFTDVLLSYVNEVDANLEHHRVRVDRLKSWAQIDALNGSTE